MNNCKCGHCAKAFAFLGYFEKDFPLCGADQSPSERARTVARGITAAQAKVAQENGSTMIMTLPSGTNIVRFLVPNAPATPAGSVGKYSEGMDKNLGTALAIALAGLNA